MYTFPDLAGDGYRQELPKHSSNSKIRVAVPKDTPFKWLFPFRGPQRQVFVDGVVEKATIEALIKSTFTLVLL
jgi:hypothetical protein